MSDELDLGPIEVRYAADGAYMNGSYQIYRTDVATLLTEVKRLRALVATLTEQRDRAVNVVIDTARQIQGQP